MSLTFNLESVTIENSSLQGNTELAVSFTEAPATGGVIAAEVGGANEPNQVYVDLSSQTQVSAQRDSWDLGFYTGTNNRVILNGSIYMATAALDATDIDAISAADVSELQPAVAVGTFDATNTAYVDSPDGSLEGTALAEITASEDSKVYLLNLGYEVGTETAEAGSVEITGEHRGWKKIRITMSGSDYILQYADLDATEHEEITISKDELTDFTFFSFNTEEIVEVQPEKGKWDLNFTVFTNEIPGYGSYGYADFIVNNLQGGVHAYMVSTEDLSYEDYTIADLDETLFIEDQRGIGSNWRNGGGPGTLPSLKENVFFIVKDGDGNVYKLRFTALLSESNERGNPSFEYHKL
ncbi:hypothetical protein DMZ48_00300 [Robertkochia solimangrovi]|nr:hypothetical protein DMZ48_00300 [Robertkochia solimangrovi]